MYSNITDDEGSGSGRNLFDQVPTMSFEDIIFDTTNGSMTLNETDTHPQNTFRYLGIAIGLIDIVLGTFGNSLTIAAFIKNRKLRKNIFNLFIANLSVIDLLTASCMMPFNVAGYFYMKWPLGNDHVTCSLQAFFYFCCGYTSVVCLLAITLNRFVGIVFPDRYVRLYSSKCRYVILLASWTVAPAFLLLPMVKAVINNSIGIPNTPIGWNEDQLLCTFVHVKAYWMPYMQTVRIMFQFLPLVIMIIAYVTIWFKVHKSNIRLTENTGSRQYRKKMESSRRAENTQLNNSPVIGKKGFGTGKELRKMLKTQEAAENNKLHKNEVEITSIKQAKQSRSKKILNTFKNVEEKDERMSLKNNNSMRYGRPESIGENTRKHKEQRLIYISVIIWLAFTILFLPSLIINLIPWKLGPRIHMAASNVTWLNSCVNPIIYVALHNRMRKEYKKIVKRFFDSLFSLDRY